MFHHIVLCKLDKPLVAADTACIISLCNDIACNLPGVITLRFVANQAGRAAEFSYAFVGKFIDETAYEHYQQSALHAALKKKIDTLASGFIVLDYPLVAMTRKHSDAISGQ